MGKLNKISIKHSRGKRVVTIVLATIIMAGALVGATYWYIESNNQVITQPQILEHDGNLNSTSAEDAISRVVDQVSPSVVSILASNTKLTSFGVAEQAAAGTGIILSHDGYVLTNHHVVGNAKTVEVVTNDGTTYDEARVIGADPLNDIAYLKIDGVENLKPAQIGDSSTLRVGQQVIAIGNALGQYQNTVSSGIISGKSRPITASGDVGENPESLNDLLQTDAAINPGNSGGPLLNYSGQVIGINTAIASEAQGIGFAIPINATKGTTETVIAGKGVQRSYIGLRYMEITAAVAKQYDLGVKKGAYVISGQGESAIMPGSPADKAGLKEKDIVTKINGQIVGTHGGVATLVGTYAPGDTVQVTYLRDGKEGSTKVTLGKY